jgi:hypothetical protein
MIIIVSDSNSQGFYGFFAELAVLARLNGYCTMI